MDVKGALFDLDTIRSIYGKIDSFEYSENYLKGVKGFNSNPLYSFRKEFSSVIRALSVLDKNIFIPYDISGTQEFVIHYENDVAEMDCVTFLDIDGVPYFIDIEVKDTEDISQLRDQFFKRENDNLSQLNVEDNYILLGFLNGDFKLGIIKSIKKRHEIKDLSEFLLFLNGKSVKKVNIVPLIKAVESVLKIQDVKKRIQENNFKYYVATRDAIDFVKDNFTNGKKVAIIYGNAGSGKTVIALSLFFGVQNAKFLLLNKNLYESLAMYKFYSNKKCFYGTNQFISALDSESIAIIDECQRLSINDVLLIIAKAKATVLLGDNNQAFCSGDSLFDEKELKQFIIEKSSLNDSDIVVKKLKKTARYNSKVNKLLETLHNTNPINGYSVDIGEKVGDEFEIDVTMSEEAFITKYCAMPNTSKIYTPLVDVGAKSIDIYNKKFDIAGIDDSGFSLSKYYDSYIGNTYHAISFDVDNAFVFLKGVGIFKRDGRFYLFERNKPSHLITEDYLIKFGNQVNILFTRGRKSLHILADDFYVYAYLNFKIKRGTK